MKFIKPTVQYNFDIKNDDLFKDLIGVKIYDNNSIIHPEIYYTEEPLRDRYKEFERYTFINRYENIGKLISASGNFIRNIQLIECVNKKRDFDFYINETTFTIPSKETVRYNIYKGLNFKMKNNHLYEWFAKDDIQQFNASVPQQLDDEGYIVMVEDLKNYIVVNYGHDLIKQEMKDVYCSVNGRYVKYKGKNYYIKEK